ncbi:MAG: M24 family metallopeptidase [Acidimicrobiales bacterium]
MIDSTPSSLAPMDVAGRIGRLRARLAEAATEGEPPAEAILVTRLVNIRYLTGFTGSAGLLLVLPDDALLVTDGRYRDQSAAEVAATGAAVRVEIALTGKAHRDLVTEAAAGLSLLALEAADVTWAAQRRYASDWFADAELVPTTGLIEKLRQVKDAGEVDRMAAAAAIADRALAEVRPQLADRPTEADIALALDMAMRRGGAQGSSFETIVASGPNGAKPHARPGSRRIEAGELVVIDFGALVDGYCSDMTRTLCVGEPSSAIRARMVEVVRASQAAGLAAVRAGVTTKEVDAACREIIAEAGWADAFLHGTGHGVGLEIHEDPRVASTSDAVLAAGEVVTVEPGVYLPEVGGVRIEDTVLVTAEGCRILTNAPKELVVA